MVVTVKLLTFNKSCGIILQRGGANYDLQTYVCRQNNEICRCTICENIDRCQTLWKIYNFENDYRLVQVKEKYAQLRWYDNGVPESISKEYDELIKHYEDLSEKTCQGCGGEATVKKCAGWYVALCDKCEEEM